MIRVMALYPNSQGAWLDFEYYRDQHMSKVRACFAGRARELRAESGLSNPKTGEPPDYLAIGHLVVDALEDWYEVMATNKQELLGDVANYTNIAPRMLYTKVSDGE